MVILQKRVSLHVTTMDAADRANGLQGEGNFATPTTLEPLAT
jgi:hypothetical protein